MSKSWRWRLTLLGLVILADVWLLGPALTRLPGYIHIGQSVRWEAWADVWGKHPGHATWTLVRPRTAADRTAREMWIQLQWLVSLAAFAVLWPATPQTPAGATGDTSRGTARWRRADELRNTLSRFGMGEDGVSAGLVAGVDTGGRQGARAAWINAGGRAINPHTLILGSSGSGKTRRIVLPSLWLLGQTGESVVVTDPKGELYSATARYFRTRGYNVRVLNLIDPRRGDRYNPLAEVAEAVAAGEASISGELAWDLAHAVVTVEEPGSMHSDPFWNQAAESLIAALSLYVAEFGSPEEQNLSTVYRLLVTKGRSGGEALDALIDALPESHPAAQAYGVFRLAQDRTRDSVAMTTGTKMRLFADQSVAAMTATSDYNLASAGREPTIIYLLLPDDRSGKTMIAAMYLMELYSALSRLATENGGRLPLPIHWVLDEFANVGRFRDWDKVVAVARGRGMSITMVLQELQQLEARYGRDLADVIAGNCDTWIYLRSNTLHTAESVSRKLGQFTLKTKTSSSSTRRSGADLSTGSSEQITGRPLLMPDEVLRWPLGQFPRELEARATRDNLGLALIMQAGQYPAKLPLVDLSEWPVEFEASGQPPLRVDPQLATATSAADADPATTQPVASEFTTNVPQPPLSDLLRGSPFEPTRGQPTLGPTTWKPPGARGPVDHGNKG